MTDDEQRTPIGCFRIRPEDIRTRIGAAPPAPDDAPFQIGWRYLKKADYEILLANSKSVESMNTHPADFARDISPQALARVLKTPDPVSAYNSAFENFRRAHESLMAAWMAVAEEQRGELPPPPLR